MTEKRNFTCVVNGKEHGTYTGSSPSSAARKVVSKMCGHTSKKVEFYLREMTQGSKKKVYGPYLGHMEKLKEPIELKGRTINYKPVAKLSQKKGGGFRDKEFSVVLPGDKFSTIVVKYPKPILERSMFKGSEKSQSDYAVFKERAGKNEPELKKGKPKEVVEWLFETLFLNENQNLDQKRAEAFKKELEKQKWDNFEIEFNKLYYNHFKPQVISNNISNKNSIETSRVTLQRHPGYGNTKATFSLLIDQVTDGNSPMSASIAEHKIRELDDSIVDQRERELLLKFFKNTNY